jgi:hypothetical protein
MTIDLTEGRAVTVDAFKGKLWLTLRARGGGITVELDPADALTVSALMTAGVKRLRDQSASPIATKR